MEKEEEMSLKKTNEVKTLPKRLSNETAHLPWQQCVSVTNKKTIQVQATMKTSTDVLLSTPATAMNKLRALSLFWLSESEQKLNKWLLKVATFCVTH